MTATRKHALIVVAATAAVLALAGTAIAATTPRGALRAAAPQAAHGYGPMAGGYGLMAGGIVMDAAADYIGISETALMTARHGGKSLAQIATANGKSVTGLQQALVAAFKVDLERVVAAGRLTSAQAAQALATFQSRVQTLVNRTATGPMYGRGGGFGRGFGHGMCGGRR